MALFRYEIIKEVINTVKNKIGYLKDLKKNIQVHYSKLQSNMTRVSGRGRNLDTDTEGRQ